MKNVRLTLGFFPLTIILCCILANRFRVFTLILVAFFGQIMILRFDNSCVLIRILISYPYQHKTEKKHA
jgi:hypothetical protein